MVWLSCRSFLGLLCCITFFCLHYFLILTPAFAPVAPLKAPWDCLERFLPELFLQDPDTSNYRISAPQHNHGSATRNTGSPEWDPAFGFQDPPADIYFNLIISQTFSVPREAPRRHRLEGHQALATIRRTRIQETATKNRTLKKYSACLSTKTCCFWGRNERWGRVGERELVGRGSIYQL